MNTLAALLSFAIAAALLLVLRPLAIRFGFLDRSGGHKSHDGAVPHTGGVAVFVGMFTGLFLLSDPGYPLLPVFVASCILVVIGALDDRFRINAGFRFGAQFVAMLILVYWAQMPLASIGDPFGTGELRMHGYTLLFTTLVTLTMINAYNLIDGVDGLAGSLALVALVSVALAAGVGHAAFAVSMVISAAVFAFLLFNFPSPWSHRYRTFMGDAGSTLLGFTIVWVTIGISHEDGRMMSPVYCLWFASIPIYDTLTCFLRRALKGRSPLSPGRDHFHHMLLDSGFGVRGVLTVLVGLQVLYATTALVAFAAGVPDVVMFTAWSVLGLTQRIVIGLIAGLRRAQTIHQQFEAGD